MRRLALPSGIEVPVLGQGTWHMGEDVRRKSAEVAALQLGLDLGMTLIDTAEMYGSGRAETVVGRAIAGRRDAVFLVSKVYPHNATAEGVVEACERSLKRLGTDRLDLYLLHWRGSVPFAETLAGFEKLLRAGKIRHHGVSNLDAEEMRDWSSLPEGAAVATDQVLYNLAERGIEWDLLPWARKRAIPIMAYTPLGDRGMLKAPALAAVARRHGASPAQIALAWLLHQPGVLTIPKASTAAHVRENRAALELRLAPEDLAELDRAFPPPAGPSPLALR